MVAEFWKNKKVLITGNTGFKGAWLSCILTDLGSKIYGISLPNENKPFYEQIKNKFDNKTFFGDIRDKIFIKKTFKEVKPEIIFHLAAQPLVFDSYDEPLSTFETNIIGTANILYEARKYHIRAIVNVTSDKCYENQESIIGYKEDDPKGGDDPYSASKGAAEIVSTSISKSFLLPKNIFTANVRAGNVIGGGDFSDNRLIPDAFIAINENKKIKIRSPEAIRPWQHVLEPLFGYIEIAEGLANHGNRFVGGWNFGPYDEGCISVKNLLDRLKKIEPNFEYELDQKTMIKKETNILKLSINKAINQLKWSPVLSVDEALTYCLEWNKAYQNNEDVFEITLNQIKKYKTKL